MKKYSVLAILVCGILLSACGRNFDQRLAKARSQFQDKNYIEAIDTIQSALPHWKEKHGAAAKGEAYEILGLSYDKLLKKDKAIEAYTNAINVGTNTYTSAINVGFILLATNQPQLGAGAFKKALLMKRDDPIALLGLGNSYFALKQYDAARLNYQRIFDTSPGVKEAMEQVKALGAKKSHPRPPKKKSSNGKLRRH